MSLNVAAGLQMIPGFGAMQSLLGSTSAPNGAPRPPLTEGIPDPANVQRQKETYARSLEEQLRKGVEVLAATHKQQTDMLHTQANQEKHRYNIALDQQVKQRELELSQQYNEQLMRLQQAAQVQRADLEQQACGLTLEYQQRKVQEEYLAQQRGIQQQHQQAQTTLDREIQKLATPIPGVAPILPPNDLLQKVQANMRVANAPPMAQYAFPSNVGQPPALPTVAPSAMRPYVPPPGSVQAAPGVQMTAPRSGPILSYLPQQGQQQSRANLSYTAAPGGAGSIRASTYPSVMASPAQGIRSYVPPTTTGKS